MKRENIAPYLIGLASGLIPLAFLPVLIAQLSPANFAAVALFATFTSVMAVFDLGASQFLLKTKQNSDLDALMIKFVLFQSLVLFGNFFFFVSIFELAPLTPAQLCVILFASSIKFASTPFKSILIKNGRIIAVNSLHLGSSLVRYSPALFPVTSEDLKAYLLSFSIAALIELFGAYWVSNICLKFRELPNLARLKAKLFQSKYISLNAIFSAASQYADRFFVLALFPIAIASSYLAIVSVGAAVFLILNPITNLFIYSVFGQKKSSSSDTFEITTALIATQTAMSFTIYFGGTYFLGLVNLPQDFELLAVLNFVLLGNILHYMLGLQYYVLLSDHKEAFFLAVNMVGAFISLVLYLFNPGALWILAAIWPFVNFAKLTFILIWKRQRGLLFLNFFGCLGPTILSIYLLGGFFGTA